MRPGSDALAAKRHRPIDVDSPAAGGSARDAREVARLGVFLALGVALHVVEAQVPALPLPGARLGLANVVSLVALYLWGAREALLLVVLRQVLGSLVTGTLLSAPFWFGLTGGMVSVSIMAAAARTAPRILSPLGVSLAGAAAHNTGQLLVAWILTGQRAVLAYLPFLLWFSLPAGALVGWLGLRIMTALPPEVAGQDSGPRGERPGGGGGVKPGGGCAVRPGDWGVGLLVAMVGVLLLWNSMAPPASADDGPARAVVIVGGRAVLELPLDQTRQVHLDAGKIHMVVETAGGRVRVRSSDCPDRICVQTGWIGKAGESIVCLPGRAVVEVRGGAKASYDAITR